MGSVERGGIDAPHLEEAVFLLKTLSADRLEAIQTAWEVNELGVSGAPDFIYWIREYRDLLFLNWTLGREVVSQGTRQKLDGFAGGIDQTERERPFVWASFKNTHQYFAIDATFIGSKYFTLDITLDGWQLSYFYSAKKGTYEPSWGKLGLSRDLPHYRNPAPEFLYNVLTRLQEVATQSTQRG